MARDLKLIFEAMAAAADTTDSKGAIHTYIFYTHAHTKAHRQGIKRHTKQAIQDTHTHMSACHIHASAPIPEEAL